MGSEDREREGWQPGDQGLISLFLVFKRSEGEHCLQATLGPVWFLESRALPWSYHS